MRRIRLLVARMATATVLLCVFAPHIAHARVICNVADPDDPTLNVRDAPGGTVINQLKNDRLVRIDETKEDASGKTWSNVSGMYQGQWRGWGWVFRKRLNCFDTDGLARQQISVGILRAAGIEPQSSMDPRTGGFSEQLPVACSIIPNGWGVRISAEAMEAYRKRGFSEDAVCLGLGGDEVNFDPETGRPLRLYQVPSPFNFVKPFWLPDCFRQVEIVKIGGYEVGWRPSGCRLRYDPSTGHPINNPEVVELAAGGEAGGGVDEDNSSSTVSQDRARQLIFGK